MVSSQDVPSHGPEMPFPAWGEEMLVATSLCTLGLPHLHMQSPSSSEGEIHPKEVLLWQRKDETWLRIPLVYPCWGSSWTCPMRCSRTWKRLTRRALLLLLFLGMLQQWLWSSPTSDPGRRDPREQGCAMGGWLVFPIHTGHWHWLFSHHQGKMKVQLNPAYPVPLCISENSRCALQQGLDLHFCPWGLQANKPNLLLWRAWPCQATALPLAQGSVDPPAAPGLAATPPLAEPKSLQDHSSPSLGWQMRSRDVWSELSGRLTVASEIPALPQNGRIHSASSPRRISQGHKSQ